MSAPIAASARDESNAAIHPDPNPNPGSPAAGEPVERWIRAGGHRWYARAMIDAAPAGAPSVVLVHGLGLSSRYMTPVLRHLAPFFPTWAPDLPGFGQTDQPPQTLTILELADALVAWLHASGIDRPILLGNSLGGQIIIDLAARHPRSLSAAVLVGPTGDPSAAGLPGFAARLLMDMPREPPSAFLVEAPDYVRAGPVRIWRTAQGIVRDQVVEKLLRVRCPVLVVRGEGDPIAPHDWTVRLADELPDGRHATVPGAAHIVNYSHPAELVALVRAFAATLPAGNNG